MISENKRSTANISEDYGKVMIQREDDTHAMGAHMIARQADTINSTIMGSVGSRQR